MGDKPVQVELLSDPNEGKADSFSFPAVNYEDPNFNVGIPVFSIHGNHDDPQGTGADGALCALDVLSVSGLLNYFGKIDLPVSDANAHNTGIAVRPLLLRKGNTYLGMYGMGNVKDQRMHFELRSNRVRMYMPKNKESWFNLLLLHQNRVKHGPQEFVPEGMFDDSIRLVVWGHEHDCRIVPEPVAGKNYYITQPGSSVATSLADGEALEKHVALLEIEGKEFQLTPIPLRTVRPFVIEDIHLISASEEEGFDISDGIEISKFLKLRVNALIERAQEQWEERNIQALAAGQPELKPMLPLIRLKVDATGVTETFNPIRFGQEFQGRIANPRDVLTFHRKKTAPGARSGKVAIDQPELSIDDPELSVQEKLAKVRVQTLVKEYLAAQELQLLGESGMSDAIKMFVEKDDIHAIEQHVEKSLNALVKGVARQDDVDEDDLEELLAKAKEQHEQQYLEAQAKVKKSKGKTKAIPEPEPQSDDSMRMDVEINGGGDSDFDESDIPAPTTKKSRTATTTRGAKASTGAGRGRKAPAATTKTTAAKKATTGKGRGRGKKAVVEESDDESAEVIEVDVSEDEDDEEEEVVPVKTTKRTNRAAVLSQPAAKKAPARKKTTAAGGGGTQSQLNFQPAARSSRAAATKARGRMVDDDSD